MDTSAKNPFSTTRAADFSDAQIYEYWVDYAESGSFLELSRPTSDMPMFISGSKGSGKTHLMRYLSYPLQKMRCKTNALLGIQAEGYLGTYLRCSGLNSARFRNKNQPEDRWKVVFAYYIELWLSQLLIENIRELTSESKNTSADGEIASAVVSLFDDYDAPKPNTLAELSASLKALLGSVDLAANNCVFGRALDVRVLATPGKLVYGIPEAVATAVPELADCVFLYLIDEFENLTIDQQRHINTLIREKRSPCSFKVGTRLYGVKTKGTDCDDEENKEGSEFETLALDDRMRADEKSFESFARRVVLRRLSLQGYGINGDPAEPTGSRLEASFEKLDDDPFLTDAATELVAKYEGRERPYFTRLAKQLDSYYRLQWGSETQSKAEAVIGYLRVPNLPLLEKLNCLLFYRAWSSNEDLEEAAVGIQQEASKFLLNPSIKGRYRETLSHFKSDLLAQLYRDCERRLPYAGLPTLVELSWGNPRHLLILLKHVFSWASFKGEHPFRQQPISVAAQTSGVREAAEWFFRDARMTGTDGKAAQDAILRLGTLFRSVRYAEKPSECSLCTFSFERSQASETANRIIDLATNWSFLVAVAGGQKDRNSERLDSKLQLNRMLAPKWDVAYGRRGALALSGPEINAIFDPDHASAFNDVVRDRVNRMEPPFRRHLDAEVKDNQVRLSGWSDD